MVDGTLYEITRMLWPLDTRLACANFGRPQSLIQQLCYSRDVLLNRIGGVRSKLRHVSTTAMMEKQEMKVSYIVSDSPNASLNMVRKHVTALPLLSSHHVC